MAALPTTTTPARQQAACAAMRSSCSLAVVARPAGAWPVSRPAAALRRSAEPARRARRGAALAVTANSAVATEARPATSVTFKTVRKLQFGQVLKVVGSAKELGSWDCGRAPVMQWSEGDRWQLTLDLPPGKHEFKVAVAQGDSLVHFEDGPNRTMQVPDAESGDAHRAFTVNCEWGSLASWLETLLPEDEARSSNGAGLRSWGQHNGNGHSDWTHHSNGNGNGHANGWHASGGQSVEALQAEVADLRRQLAARGEEAAAFSRACDQLRAERDSLAHQLSLAQQQLAAANEEKAVLAAAAAKSERNIHLLRQVGQLLSSMHE